MGALLAARIVISEVGELYDYRALRQLRDATMFVLDPQRRIAVLGARQSSDLLDPVALGGVSLRRRRGGGGLVLLQPGDLWIDFWIPADDARWTYDVHFSALMVGEWWRRVLAPRVDGDVVVHTGSLEGDERHRVVCFAGRGPGEVFVDGHKAVGVTQWRVREGVFLSSVVHAHSSSNLIDLLFERPPGLADALNHLVVSSFGGLNLDTVVEELCAMSGPWRVSSLTMPL